MQKKKVVKKAVTTHTSDDVKRYLGSLSEDFQHKVAAIGENLIDVKTGLKEIQGKLAEHDQHFKVVHLALGQSREDLNVLKTDSDIIKGGLKKKVDYDEFQALTRRVAALERSRR